MLSTLLSLSVKLSTLDTNLSLPLFQVVHLHTHLKIGETAHAHSKPPPTQMCRFSICSASAGRCVDLVKMLAHRNRTQVINVIFLLGQASEYNWQMWMQICLVFAALLSHFTSPYHLKADNRQEQMSFLGLSVVLTITTSGITYSGGWRWYHVCVVVSVVALMTILMIWHQCEAIMTRQKQYEHVRKGLDRMEDDGFVEQVFESVEFRSSGFALLRLNHKTFQKDFSDKDFIKKHFQVSLHTAMYRLLPRHSMDGLLVRFHRLRLSAKAKPYMTKGTRHGHFTS